MTRPDQADSKRTRRHFSLEEDPTEPAASDTVDSGELGSDGGSITRLSGPGHGERRPGHSVRLAPAGVVLVLVLVGIVVYLIASGWFDGLRLTGQTTPTLPQAVNTYTPSASPQTPFAMPSATPLAPAELDSQLAQAWDLVLRSQFEDAIRLYEDLIQQVPDHAGVESDWAWALILDGQGSQALPHARRAVELDPLNAETMTVLARAYIEVGDKERAVGMAEGAVQLNNNSSLAHAILAEAYLLEGRLQDAIVEANLALARDANEAEAHRVRGWLYQLVDQDLGEAIGELRAAANLQPQLWLRHYELALMLIEADDYEAAVVALNGALGLRAKAATYTRLGEAYYNLGKYDQARSTLLQAVAAGAEDAGTYALLAATDAQQGRCDEAIPHLEQALAQDADPPLASVVRTICLRVEPTPGPTLTEPLPTAPPLTGQIAFPVWNTDKGWYDIYLARPDGSERHMVVEEMHQPAFSPDGLWLAANGERQNHMNLFITRPDGSDLNEISEYIEDSLPCWSPDGSSLVFSSTRNPDRQSRVYIIDEVPYAGEKAQGRPLTSDLYEVLGEYPAWTDDGRIVYAGCDFTATPSLCGLFLIPSEPGPQTAIQLTTDAGDTAPATHGDRIAFMSSRDGNWEIYLINEDGSGLRRLTDSPADDGLPAWAPDGKTLAFVSKQGGVWAVWAMSPDGSSRRKLFDLGGGGLATDWQHERISWGP